MPKLLTNQHTVFSFAELHLLQDQMAIIKALNTVASYCLAQSSKLASVTAKVTREELEHNLRFIDQLHFFSDGTPCIKQSISKELRPQGPATEEISTQSISK